MKELDRNNLIEYLKHAINLESAVIGQEQIIEQYNTISERSKPQLRQQSMPQKPDAIITDNSNINIRKYIDIGIAGFGFILAIIPAASDDVDFKGNEFAVFLGLAMLIIGIVLFVRNNNITKKATQENTKRYEAMLEAYNRQSESIRKQNAAATLRYNEAKSAWDKSNSKALDELHRHLNDSKRTLSTYYSADVIFPKYRNLPALTSIYEYITSGRCAELAGANGAYNLYENELRQNTVIAQLNTIISNLEQIRQNQYTLYTEIVKINQSTERIANELRTIRGYTYVLTELSALNTYYNGVTAASSSAIAFYNAIS